MTCLYTLYYRVFCFWVYLDKVADEREAKRLSDHMLNQGFRVKTVIKPLG